MTTPTGRLQGAAELYLCLGRAFAVPDGAAAHRAIAEYLADDLADIGVAHGYPIAHQVDALRAALAGLPDAPGLLQRYSALFLVPPAPVPLNTGVYLDGAVYGGSVRCVEDRYRRHGLERSATFHDLPDHVVLELEFVARLFAASAAAEAGEAQRLEAGAREFLGDIVAAWLPGLGAALTRAAKDGRAVAPYRQLADILQIAVACDAPSPQPVVRSPPAEAAPVGALTDAQLAEIAAALAAHGQPADHLAVPPAARDAALGLTPATPPRSFRQGKSAS